VATFQLTKSEAEELGNFQSGSTTFGPLTITWNIDITIPQIVVDATLLGVSIGHAVINKDNPSVTLGGSIGIFTAKATINADFDKRQLMYDVDVRSFGHTVVKKSGILVSW
jgi:hypothetical protein